MVDKVGFGFGCAVVEPALCLEWGFLTMAQIVENWDLGRLRIRHSFLLVVKKDRLDNLDLGKV